MTNATSLLPTDTLIAELERARRNAAGPYGPATLAGYRTQAHDLTRKLEGRIAELEESLLNGWRNHPEQKWDAAWIERLHEYEAAYDAIR